MKILELFAGTRCIGKAFEKKSHKVFSIEWDKIHKNIDWYTDIGQICALDILEKFGYPDIIWSSNDCTTYSVAGISHHRRKDEDGNLRPISDYAIFSDKVNENVMKLIKELNPKLFFIENPMGGMRKMNFIRDVPRFTVTYCAYGDDRMKTTDIFSNHPNPNFKPPCKNGDPCHIATPRGSRTGTQGRKNSIEKSLIPEELCDYIVKISEDYVNQIKE